MAGKRVVITGIGVVSPIGIGKEEFWKNLFAGQSGFRDITLFDTKDLKVKTAGEITNFNAKDILGKKGLVDLDRATTLLLSATKFALEDSGFEINEANACKTGLSVGTTFGSLNSLSEFDQQSLEEGPNFVNASRFPNTVINSPASRTAIRYGIKGPNSTLSTGFCASLDALEYALYCINSDKAEQMIVGAVEEMCIQTFLGFYKLGYLSGLNSGRPMSCPFDKRRDGIIFSEGSVVLILEELSLAFKRKAHIYAEILGIDSNFDPYRLHKFNPKGAGIINVIESILKKVNLDPTKIDCVFANANSTQDADLVEANAINKVFGNSAKNLAVTAVKSIIGETFSSGGAFSLSAAIGSIEKENIPPVVNLKDKDTRCNLDYIVNTSCKKNINRALIDCFGPNGANSVLVVSKCN